MVSANPRYERIVQEFGDTGRGAGTLGMHVHVDVADDEEGVRVIDGLRPWLPLLTALTSNSPYASGRDTGYASWRQQVWTRWPTSGTAEPFGSAAEYHRVGDTLIRLGAALDDGMLYYDARLSASYPTVEIRVADTCTDVDDAVLAAALARALVETLAQRSQPAEAPAHRPAPSGVVALRALRPDRRPRPSGDAGTWCPPAEALAGAGRRGRPALWRPPGTRALVEDGLARLASAAPARVGSGRPSSGPATCGASSPTSWRAPLEAAAE